MITWSTFVALTKEEARGLTEAYGFSVTSEICPFVRFAKDDIEISFYFDAHGHGEFDVGFKKDNFGRSEFMPSIGLGNLLSKKCVSFTESEFLQLTSEDEARSELRRTVDLIQRHLQDVLQGDSSCLEPNSKS
ncbi:MAG: hypothetical protein JJT75_14485 [Opitutales bacterium]|nr:hypothetical protein [Opitutales bacterium]MCH8541478.1 hypothetical protein [Opitutales bacterium]